MANYELEGPLWTHTTVTWSFATANYSGAPASFDSYISSSSFYASEIKDAFARWDGVANIDFVQVADSASVDIRIGYEAIDGPFNTLAVTNYNYYGSSFNRATISFDSGEIYTLSAVDALLGGGGSFYEVALHEIGHTIGLGHYNTSPAIMNSYLNPLVTDLTSSEIAGVQALYGPEGSSNTVGTITPMTTSGTLTTAKIGTIYQNVLQRAPSGAETASWSNGTESDLRTSLVNSSEANLYVDPIVRLYQSAFGRVPDKAGLDVNVDVLHQTNDIVALAKAFVVSQEFLNLYGTNSVSDAFISALYHNVLGRNGTSTEISNWKATGASASSMLIGFSESAEFKQSSDAAVSAFLTKAASGTESYTGTLSSQLAVHSDAPVELVGLQQAEPDAFWA